MNLQGMYSVYAFAKKIATLPLLCEQREESFTLKYDNETITRNYIGAYYYLDMPNVFSSVYFWLGVYFEREDPVLCLSFNDREDWAASVCALFPKGSEGSIQGRTFSRPYYENNQLWFEFSEEQAKRFDELSNPNEQLELIYEFVAEIIKLIIQKAQS